MTRIGDTQVTLDGEPDLVVGVSAIEGGVVLAAQVGEDEVFVEPLEPIPALPGFSTVRSVLARVDEQGDYVWTRLFEATQLGNNNPNAFLRDIDNGPDATAFTGMTFGNFRLDGGPTTTCSRCAFFGWVDDGGEIAGPHFLSLDAPVITLITSMPDAVAIAGANNFPTNFGGAILNNNTGNAGAGADINIGVFDLGGAHLWSRRWGGVGTERIGGLDTTLGGDLVLSGTTDAQIDFGGGLLGGGDTQPPDVVVARLAGVDGEHMWSRVFETFATDAPPSFSIDTRAVVQGDVLFVSISAREMAVDVDGQEETGSGHIVALDVSTGATLWHRNFDGPLEIQSIDARCDGVAVTGSYQGAMSYDGLAAPTPAGEDAFVMMVSVEDGSVQWLQTMTDATQGSESQTGLDVALGAEGSLWWGGEFVGDINLGTGLVQSGMGSPRPDGFVARLDP